MAPVSRQAQNAATHSGRFSLQMYDFVAFADARFAEPYS